MGTIFFLNIQSEKQILFRFLKGKKKLMKTNKKSIGGSHILNM